MKEGDILGWIFKPRGDQKVRNPLGDEFFNSPDLLTDTSSLVREAIQNSLDARVDMEQPVRVRFKLGAISDPGLKQDFFADLEVHTKSVLGASRGKISNDCRFLVYEDFNTEGLRGDTTLDHVAGSLEKESANYTYFVHYEGEGNKGDGKRGKWGIGKVVFPMISKINAFFAYSIRDEEHSPCGNNPVLIGQCVLKFHEIHGQTFQPDGWFSPDAVSTPQPFSGKQATEIAKKWGVSRISEPGLSVIIPYVLESVGANQLRDAVIRQYFIAILSGDLICTIEDQNGQIITVNANSISAIVEELDELTEGSTRDLQARQVNKAIEALGKTSKLEGAAVSNHWKIADKTTAPSTISVPKEVVETVKREIEVSGVSLTKIETATPKQFSKETEIGTFDILIWRDEDSTNPVIYSREGILVPGSRATNLRNYGALVLVDNGPLADLLGKSEGPAHEEWSDKTERFADAYHLQLALASRLIRLVRLLPQRMQQELSKKDNQESDDIFFSDWFSSENQTIQLKKNLQKKERDDLNDVIPNGLLPMNPKMSISAAHGKVSVSPGQTLGAKGDLLKIEFAYAVSKGNAFSNWSELDFSFNQKGSVKIKETGLRIIRKTQNSLELEIEKVGNWQLTLDGFDPYRDLEVKASISSSGE